MKLDQETIDDGREHPFALEVVAELRRRHGAHVRRLCDLGALGEGNASLMSSVGGRVAGIQEALAVITEAEQENPE